MDTWSRAVVVSGMLVWCHHRRVLIKMTSPGLQTTSHRTIRSDAMPTLRLSSSVMRRCHTLVPLTCKCHVPSCEIASVCSFLPFIGVASELVLLPTKNHTELVCNHILLVSLALFMKRLCCCVSSPSGSECTTFPSSFWSSCNMKEAYQLSPAR